MKDKENHALEEWRISSYTRLGVGRKSGLNWIRPDRTRTETDGSGQILYIIRFEFDFKK